MVQREQELWGMALWVERRHGARGWFHIAQEIDRHLAEGDPEGAALWRAVGQRFDRLAAACAGGVPN